MTDDTPEHKHNPDDLLSAAEIGEALGMGVNSVWLFARDAGLPRFRVRARGKTTLFRWRDVWAAYNEPRPIEPSPRDKGKAAA